MITNVVAGRGRHDGDHISEGQWSRNQHKNGRVRPCGEGARIEVTDTESDAAMTWINVISYQQQ
jgi:hypothetical protein